MISLDSLANDASLVLKVRHPFALAVFFGSSMALAGPGALSAEAQVYSPSAACMTCEGGQAYRIVYQTVYEQRPVRIQHSFGGHCRWLLGMEVCINASVAQDAQRGCENSM